MLTFSSFIKKVRDILLYLLLFVSGISYHPTIIRMSHLAGYESGTILSRYIVLLFGIVLLLSLNGNAFKHSQLVKKYTIWLLVIFVVGLMPLAFFNNMKMITEIRTFLIILGAILIGYDFRFAEKKKTFLILAFCLPTLYSGLIQVLVNIGGFQIMDQYLADSKNSLGAMLATTCFSLFYLFCTSTHRTYRVILFLLTMLALAIIITIRARMAMLSLFLVVIFYYYLLKRNSNFIISLVVLGVVAFFAVLLLPDSMFNYLESSFTAGSQSEDISSGRFETYGEALYYLSFHPFLGNIQRKNQISWVHNYLLLKLYDYGILFSWPIITLYFVIIIRSVKKSFRFHPKSVECYGVVCLLIPYLISIAEPTFPFGPGTVTVFNFVLLGVAERSFMMEPTKRFGEVEAAANMS